MKGHRPPSKPPETKNFEPIPVTEDLIQCNEPGGHCMHIVIQETVSDCEVCCRCGATIWFTYGRDMTHGPFVQNRKFPDSPYYHPSFASTSSHRGVSWGMGERNVSRFDPDSIGSSMDDSTVAKWLR